MSQRPIWEFYGELYKIETRRDGGGRITIDFGSDSLVPIQQIQRLAQRGDISFAFAMVPWYSGDEKKPKMKVDGEE